MPLGRTTGVRALAASLQRLRSRESRTCTANGSSVSHAALRLVGVQVSRTTTCRRGVRALLPRRLKLLRLQPHLPLLILLLPLLLLLHRPLLCLQHQRPLRALLTKTMVFVYMPLYTSTVIALRRKSPMLSKSNMIWIIKYSLLSGLRFAFSEPFDPFSNIPLAIYPSSDRELCLQPSEPR